MLLQTAAEAHVGAQSGGGRWVAGSGQGSSRANRRGIHAGPWEDSKPAVDLKPGLAVEIEDGGKTFPEKEFTWFAK